MATARSTFPLPLAFSLSAFGTLLLTESTIQTRGTSSSDWQYWTMGSTALSTSGAVGLIRCTALYPSCGVDGHARQTEPNNCSTTRFSRSLRQRTEGCEANGVISESTLLLYLGPRKQLGTQVLFQWANESSWEWVGCFLPGDGTIGLGSVY